MSAAENTQENTHVPSKLQYALDALRNDPFEFARLFHVAFATYYARFIKRTVGPNTTVERGVRFVNPSNISIGANSWLKEYCYLRAGVNGYIRVGERIAFNSFVTISGHGGVEIGDDTQLGPGATLTTTGHDYRAGLQASFSKITLGKRVWVGARAIILPGVTIGDNTVIGAGALVNKDLPANCVAVGVPARIIKRFDDENEAQQHHENGHAAPQNAVVIEGGDA